MTGQQIVTIRRIQFTYSHLRLEPLRECIRRIERAIRLLANAWCTGIRFGNVTRDNHQKNREESYAYGLPCTGYHATSQITLLVVYVLPAESRSVAQAVHTPCSVTPKLASPELFGSSVQFDALFEKVVSTPYGERT